MPDMVNIIYPFRFIRIRVSYHFFVFDTIFSTSCHQSLPVGLHPFAMVSIKLNHMAAHISLEHSTLAVSVRRFFLEGP